MTLFSDKKKHLLILLLLISLLTTFFVAIKIVYKEMEVLPFYSYDRFLSDSNTIEGSPSHITKAEAQAEIDQLVHVLKKAYVGKEISSEKVDSATEELINLPLEPMVDVQNFVWQINNILRKIPDENARAYIEESEISSSSQHSSNNEDKSNTPWKVALKNSKKGKILQIEITSFLAVSSREWVKFCEKVKTHLPEASTVVIDLRGSTGDNKEIAEKLSSLLYGDCTRPVKTISSSHSISHVMVANEIEKIFINTPSEDNKQLKKLQHDYQVCIIKAKQVAWEKHVPALVEKESPLPYSEKMVEKPIFILVGKNCPPAGLDLIDFLANHPHVETVGEARKQKKHFVNPGFFTLPYSKIAISLSTEYISYYDLPISNEEEIQADHPTTSEKAYDHVSNTL